MFKFGITASSHRKFVRAGRGVPVEDDQLILAYPGCPGFSDESSAFLELPQPQAKRHPDAVSESLQILV